MTTQRPFRLGSGHTGSLLALLRLSLWELGTGYQNTILDA
jgi:hypothetical protein